MNKLFIITVLSLIFCSFTAAQSLRDELEKVKKIKLLESNRDDVRKIFASYKSELGDNFDHSDIFNTNGSQIVAQYSEGKCEDADSEGFDVSEWKVFDINVTFQDLINFKDLRLDLSNYKKERVYSDTKDYYVYHSKNLGMVYRVNKNKLEGIRLIPPQKYYNLMCDKEKSKILISTQSLFDRPLEERFTLRESPTASVKKLRLNLTKIKTSCNLANSEEKNSCSKTSKIIKVFALGIDLDGDVLTYNYTVTGGKIIGTGAKVLWDLSNVKPGTYTITAAVDDGCGFCGKTMTKTVTVKECPDCKQK